jgi:DNA-binding NarL/FixJ family response regulator
MDLSVLVVDADPLFRIAVRVVLHSTLEIDRTYDAASGAAALRLALALQPSMVLLDLNLPDLASEDVVAELTTLCPQTRVLLHAEEPDLQTILDCIRAGAYGFVTKSSSHAELISTLYAVQQNEYVVPPALAPLLLPQLQAPAAARSRAAKRAGGLPYRGPLVERHFARPGLLAS